MDVTWFRHCGSRARVEWGAIAVAICLLACSKPDDSPMAPSPGHVVRTLVEQRIVQKGLAIDFRIQGPGNRSQSLRSGDTVTFLFAIRDTTAREPMSGLYPAAWMDLRPPGDGQSPQRCRDKVEAFVGGSLLARAELDLNVYHVLVLNDDATLTVVDPLFGFGATKLLARVVLPSPGEDWVFSPAHNRLFVSLPQSNQIAVVRPDTWTVIASIDAGLRPTRLALQADENYLWVAHDGFSEGDGRAGVSVVDVDRLEVVATIHTGRGPHDIALAGNRTAFVTNQKDNTISIVDILRRERWREVTAGRAPMSAALSTTGGALYVAHRDGTLAVIDTNTGALVARLQTHPGVAQVKFAPGGRLALVLNTEHNRLSIVDAAAQRVVQTSRLAASPDQIAFSDNLAYVRQRDSEQLLTIPLDEIGKPGQPIPVIEFPGGYQAPGGAARPSLASAIAAAPGAAAVLIANPADKTIYYYKEGMAAPMGGFQNYGRRPRAVLALDRSLKENGPGVYQTTATLGRPGSYDVAFFLDSPRVIHCFPVAVKPGEQPARTHDRRLRIEPLPHNHPIRAGQPVPLRFHFTDAVKAEPHRGARDVNVLAFSPGRWQERHWAKETAPGLYEVPFSARKPGLYYVFVSSDSLGIRYQDSPRVLFQVNR